MKYHIKNKISKREIRKQGKNIIPLHLMKNNKLELLIDAKTDRDRPDRDRDSENPFDNEVV